MKGKAIAMDGFKIMHEMDKKQYCRNIYEMHITKTAEIIEECQTLAMVYKKLLPISCYTNFRDALFHFRKLYCSVEEADIFNQGFAVKEHLNRSVSDALGIIYRLFSWFTVLLIEHGELNDSDERFAREWMHKLRTEGLYKRLNGMMIFDRNSLRLSDEDAISMLMEFSRAIIARGLQLKCADLSEQYGHEFK